MDILFLLCLIALFVVQIIMMVSSIKKNKKKLFFILFLLEIVSILIAIFVNYYFNEIMFKYAPNFEGFFEILCSSVCILLYIIMLVITSIVYVVKITRYKIV